MEKVGAIVAGGGVIGLAVARALALAGHEVLVLERNGDLGLETSGRNSEVIHAGIYYPEGSLKARLCRRGRALLIDYLTANRLPFDLCGKLIVASTEAQSQALDGIARRAEANGVTSLRRLERDAVLALEPELSAMAALQSPETGIFDSRAYLLSLAGDLAAEGGAIALGTEVVGVQPAGEDYVVETVDADGAAYALATRVFVNAAGLGASALGARIETPRPWAMPETRFARGTWYAAEGRTPFRHLVYPVPEPGGLGIHLTLDLNGTMRFGPDVEWIDAVDYWLSDHREAHFRAAISRYWPGVESRALAPVSCGVRPKIVAKGEPDADFCMAGPESHGLPRLVQLFGIESPGLTASLAIAEDVVARIGAP